MKTCKVCSKEFNGPSYKYCSHECFKAQKKDKEKRRYHTHKERITENRKIPHKCKACGADFVTFHKDSPLCPKCRKESRNTDFIDNSYIFDIKTWKHYHRVLAEKILERKLSFNEVIHHVDENQENNNVDNLWVMSRYSHGSLHSFLRLQRIIFEKTNQKGNWNDVRLEQSLAWVQNTGAKIIKLNEIEAPQL